MYRLTSYSPRIRARVYEEQRGKLLHHAHSTHEQGDFEKLPVSFIIRLPALLPPLSRIEPQ